MASISVPNSASPALELGELVLRAELAARGMTWRYALAILRYVQYAEMVLGVELAT